MHLQRLDRRTVASAVPTSDPDDNGWRAVRAFSLRPELVRESHL
jgi:hypothetical protein